MQSDKYYRYAFIAFLAFVFLFQISQNHNYGICWDEPVQQAYGEASLKFYTSLGKDTSGFYVEGKKMHIYGAFVETSAAALCKVMPGDSITIRHLYFSLFGILLVLFTGLMGGVLGGWRAAFFAALFAFFSPVLMGQSNFNSKDVPLAAEFAATLFFLLKLLREFPTLNLRTLIGLIITLAITISTRVTALLFFGYIPLFGTAVLLLHFFENHAVWKENLTQIYLRYLVVGLAVLLLSYFLGMLMWPYGLVSPIKHPLQVLQLSAHYDDFNSYGLFAGHWLNRWEIPWYYLPTWIWINSPLFINLGLVLLPFYGWLVVKKDYRSFVLVCCLAFSILFPIGFAIFNHSNVYDGWRHFFFVYPSLVVLCAYLFHLLLEAVPDTAKRYVQLAIAAMVLQPTVWMLLYHPLEAFYFSPVIGGTSGAFKNYEIDYYGSSLKNAVDWIGTHADSLHHAPNGKIRVRCFYGERFCSDYFIQKYPKLEYVAVREESSDWDYSIVLPAQAKHNTALLLNWNDSLYKHEVKIGDAVVVAIQENKLAPAESFPPTVQGYIDKSLVAFNNRDFVGCVAACEKCLQLDNCNAIAYNNIATSLYLMQYYAESMDACKKGISCNPTFVLLKNNLKEAETRQKTDQPIAQDKALMYAINMSLAYYNLGNFETSADYAKKALKVDGNDLIALNNLGSDYNQLKQYSKAKAIFEEALRINPNYELAKNNLKDVLSKMK